MATLIPITAEYLDLDQSGLQGMVTFQLNAPMQDAAANIIYPTIPLPIPLDPIAGTISLQLPASNDPTTTPTGLSYHVTEEISRVGFPLFKREYDIEVPYNTIGVLDLADVPHVTNLITNSYVLVSTFNAVLRSFDFQETIVNGVALVANNVFPPGFQVPNATTFTSLTAHAGTAPVGAGLTVRVNLDGISIGSVTIPAGQTLATATISKAALADQILTFDITAIGSSTAGSDVSIRIKGQ